jgi:hypothetical protein
MNIIYSRTKVQGAAYRPDVRVLNPRFFTEVSPGAKKVFLNGDLPEVKSAYEAAKVPVKPFTTLSDIPVIDAPAKAKAK